MEFAPPDVCTWNYVLWGCYMYAGVRGRVKNFACQYASTPAILGSSVRVYRFINRLPGRGTV